MGDAAPSEFRNRRELSIPDILIVPFAYATTESAWRITKSIGAKHIILFHMPERQYDNFGIWNSVEEVIKFDGYTYISEIGKRYTFS